VSSASPEKPRSGRARRPTSTASFGSSRRESHDASAFYGRFVAPDLSSDDTVVRPAGLDVLYQGDARDMSVVESSSIALVVTSPPYFAGKEYEEDLGRNGVPATYFEYLALLADVFDECKRVLEPGGRIAVNVANLGRRPYRSLAGDVTEIMQELGLLLRGEVIWWKGRAAGGSCAWGSFQRPANPVLRDVTERVIIASKGRFDRAHTPEQRHALGLPSTSTITREEFMEATTDLWEIPTESARRVGHPAPFPVALPRRLIELYTYEGDVVLDPFMGSGSTALAAVRTRRRFVGFETDRSYVDRSKVRIAEETDRLHDQQGLATIPIQVRRPAVAPLDDGADPLARALRDGRKANEVAVVLLGSCGFLDIRTEVKFARLGIELDIVAVDHTGAEWTFDMAGAFTSGGGGLRRADVLWKALGKGAVLHQARADLPFVILTTDGPTRGSAGSAALKTMTGTGRPVLDVVELLDRWGHDRLRTYARFGRPS